MFLGPSLFSKRNVLVKKLQASHAPSSLLLRSLSSEGYLGSTFGGSNPAHRIATLTLEDGTVLKGASFGAERPVAGEVVFNTGMVGYPESLTDPSYKGQMLCMTSPIIGNYGVPSRSEIDEFGVHKFFESDKIHVSSLLVQDYSHHHSHWNSNSSLSEWLKENNVPGLYGLDTRLLTKRIRDKGSMLAKIEFDSKIDFENPNARNLIAEVSRTNVEYFGKGNPFKVLAVDCGIKNNIIRNLVKRGAEVKLVPWNYDITKESFDGLFLSNGPGDPALADVTARNVKTLMDRNDNKPIFGICMGNQLVAKAVGAKTYKMPFGNRGQNIPVINVLTNQCYISPQNHGYAIDEKTLPSGTIFSF
jgi:carbamoyl-phosphate synthase (ammonia)